MRKHFRVPPFAKNAKDGAPILLVMPAKSKSLGHPPVVVPALFAYAKDGAPASVVASAV
jgi:hypothetical protein